MAIIILGVPLPPKEQGERHQAFPAPVRTFARAGTDGGTGGRSVRRALQSFCPKRQGKKDFPVRTGTGGHCNPCPTLSFRRASRGLHSTDKSTSILQHQASALCSPCAGTSSEKHSLRKLHQKENVLTDMFTVNVALHTKKSGLRKTGLFCSAYEDLN